MYNQKDKKSIKNLFDNISSNYDYMNDIMSIGFHRLTKKKAVKNLPEQKRGTIIDLACGTGDITRLLAKRYPFCQIIGIDFSKSMLDIAKKKSHEFSNIKYIKYDITQIDELFAENSISLCFISFGLRNLPSINDILLKIYKILKPKGLISILDLGHPTGIIKYLYYIYFYKILPLLGRFAANKKQEYKYLTKSLKTYPKQKELIKMLTKNKFKHTKNYNFFLGIIAQQTGIK